MTATESDARQALADLQRDYGHRYKISYTGTIWVATCGPDDGTEPTLTRHSAEELRAVLANPPLRPGYRGPVR